MCGKSFDRSLRVALCNGMVELCFICTSLIILILSIACEFYRTGQKLRNSVFKAPRKLMHRLCIRTSGFQLASSIRSDKLLAICEQIDILEGELSRVIDARLEPAFFGTSCTGLLVRNCPTGIACPELPI